MGLTDFRCVDVGNTDFDTIVPERITVHDAINSWAGPASLIGRSHYIGYSWTSDREYDAKRYD
jgi:hypothetical protein